MVVVVLKHLIKKGPCVPRNRMTLGLIFLLAYVEEGIWDLTVWKEHKNIFSLFHQFSFHTDRAVLSIVVPLPALPQITHYIIDGFIWKRSKEY